MADKNLHSDAWILFLGIGKINNSSSDAVGDFVRVSRIDFFVHLVLLLKKLLDVYTENGYNGIVIKTFADRETEKVYHQQFSRKLPGDIQRIALRKLIMMDDATNINDLRVPPSNHLEQLHGDREGQHSIRINGKYRICFTVKDNDLYDVEIVDYH